MKRFLVGVLVITATVTLVAGKQHWDEKLDSVYTKTEQAAVKVKAETQDSSTEEIILTAAERKDEIAHLTKNLPNELKGKFAEATPENPLQLAILGSASTSLHETAWPNLLKKDLLKSYGENYITITIQEIKQKTSAEVVKEMLYQGTAAAKPDILLIEPFLLYDNGKVTMPNRLENLTTMLNEFRNANKDISILIQPANPIPDSFHYPKEEYDLKRFAKRNNYIYLNHWEAWPDKLTDHLTKDNLPNEEGNKIWAGFLAKYFINM